MNSQESQPLDRITKVEKHKRGPRYDIYVNDDTSVTVHEDTLIRHRLIKGTWIDRSMIEQIAQEEERNETYRSAVRYLQHRPRSVHEIRQKLRQQGYADEWIDEAIAKLTDQGYIDDKAFASQWAKMRLYSQQKGRRWIQQELAHKGISTEQIQQAMNELDEEKEQALALQLGQKRWNQLQGLEEVRRRRVGEFLLRRGFPNDIVVRVLRQLMETAD